jgi:hypothetical protein
MLRTEATEAKLPMDPMLRSDPMLKTLRSDRTQSAENPEAMLPIDILMTINPD